MPDHPTQNIFTICKLDGRHTNLDRARPADVYGEILECEPHRLGDRRDWRKDQGKDSARGSIDVDFEDLESLGTLGSLEGLNERVIMTVRAWVGSFGFGRFNMKNALL